jgi:hypothetical protein
MNTTKSSTQATHQANVNNTDIKQDSHMTASESPSSKLDNTPHSEPSQPVEIQALDAIADDLISDMPDVSQHAIDAENQRESAEIAKFAHLTDRFGVSFDPAIHKTKADGSPSLTKTDKLIRRPEAGSNSPGRKPTDKTPGKTGDEKSPDQTRIIQAHASAQVATAVLINLGVGIGGDEWKPRKLDDFDESEYLTSAFRDYFAAQETPELSPKAALSIALMAYAMPRFAMPNTRKRSATGVKWVYTKWVEWRTKRKMKKERAHEKALEKSFKKEG